MASGVAVFSWLGPVVLLVSALLTAGYLLPVSISSFFPRPASGEAAALETSCCELKASMLWPLVALPALTLILGLWPSLSETAVSAVAAACAE